MNVLFIVSWYTPMGREKLEAGVFHYEQAMDLKKECNVAIYYPFDTDIGEAGSCSEEWGLKTYRSRYIPGKVFYTKRQIGRMMERIVQEFQPDIIHAHCAGAAGYYACDPAKKYHLPLVITEHSPIEITKADRFGISRLFSGKAYKNSAANICVSEDSKNKLSQAFPKDSFEVIYNGIILPAYEEGSQRYYKDGYLNIVIVAILYDLEIKGMKYLLQAVKRLKECGEKVILHHIGAGEFLEHFKHMAVELGVEDICIFYGGCERKQLYEIVNEMDFFVSASLIECSGVSVQEAMLLGKPVLGTNSGGVDSLVPQKAGHIVEKANAQALADGILYMKEHLAEFDREWIREYAYESFEIGHISRKYMELYKSIKGRLQNGKT